jgi:hypothetical protein
LVLHRHKLVEIRSRVKNELQHLSLNKGVQRKAKLWSQAGRKRLRELPLKPWAACRRAAAGGRRKSASEAADDATGRGSEHGAGFCADHRRCEPVSAG